MSRMQHDNALHQVPLTHLPMSLIILFCFLVPILVLFFFTKDIIAPRTTRFWESQTISRIFFQIVKRKYFKKETKTLENQIVICQNHFKNIDELTEKLSVSQQKNESLEKEIVRLKAIVANNSTASVQHNLSSTSLLPNTSTSTSQLSASVVQDAVSTSSEHFFLFFFLYTATQTLKRNL